MKEGLQPSTVESADAECRRLQEENARLRQLLVEHNIAIPPNPPANPPAVKSALPPEDRKERARKRIALFRSLFRGREDIYARRWESPDGRSGYTSSPEGLESD